MDTNDRVSRLGYKDKEHTTEHNFLVTQKVENNKEIGGSPNQKKVLRFSIQMRILRQNRLIM